MVFLALLPMLLTFHLVASHTRHAFALTGRTRLVGSVKVARSFFLSVADRAQQQQLSIRHPPATIETRCQFAFFQFTFGKVQIRSQRFFAIVAVSKQLVEHETGSSGGTSILGSHSTIFFRLLVTVEQDSSGDECTITLVSCCLEEIARFACLAFSLTVGCAHSLG